MPSKPRRFTRLCRMAALLAAILAPGTAAATQAAPPRSQDPPARTSKPDFIVYGGDVVTLDAAGTVAEAVWVRNGRIEGVGTREEMMRNATAATELIDLHGGALLPGFVEPHVHLDFLTMMSFFTDLSPCLPERYETRGECPKDIFHALKLLKQKAKELDGKPGSEWILGYGIDPAVMSLDGAQPANVFQEKPAAFLDQYVSSTRPVVILDKSGHLAFANLQAFVAAKICEDAETCGPKTACPRQPPGPGRWVAGKDGRYTGLLLEQQAYGPFVAAIPEPPTEEFIDHALSFAKDFARAGVTTMVNGGTQNGPQDVDLLPTLARRTLDRPVLRYRTLLAVAPAGNNSLIPAKPSPWDESYDGLYGVTGIKLWADGSTQGCTANLIDRYAKEGQCGAVEGLGLSEQQIFGYLEQFWKAGWPIQIHVNGDQGILNVVNALAALQAGKQNPSPITLLHFTVDGNPAKGEDMVQPVADLRTGRYVVRGSAVPPVNISVSHLIGHVAYWGGALQNLLDGVRVPGQPDDQGRAARIDATRREVELKVPFSLHSDAPVSPVRPLWYVEQAVTRQTWFYPKLRDDQAQTMPGGQGLTIEQALRAVTIEPARQSGLDQYLGSIEPGKVADLVILDKNPLRQPADAIHKIRVLSTFVGGSRLLE